MKKYIVLLMTGLLLGCSTDFLELEDPNNLVESNYPTSAADIEQLLQGAYGTQHAFGLYGHTMLAKNLFCWDHTQDMAWLGTQTWINLAQNDTRASDPFLQDTWNDSYKGVQRANTILEIVERFRTEDAHGVTPEQLNTFEGQAHYLRAWFYFNLISIWGETFIIDGQGRDGAGVPLITTVAGSNDETAIGRSSVGEVWDFIIGELKQAESLLENTSWSGADIYKVNVWSIRAFLGKVYAFTDDWQSARTYLQDVVENSGKSLVPFQVYKDMFNGENEFNSESLIEIPLTDDVGGNANTDLTTGSWIGMIIAPSWANDAGSPVGSGWSNAFPHRKNLRRFGYGLAHYFDAGVTEANANNVRAGYVDEANAVRENKSVDPRLWVAMLQPYVDFMTVGGIQRAISHYHDGVEVQMDAWSFRKYVYLKNNQTSVRNFGANIYFLRLADVYLLYAEALIETGDPVLGLEFVNKVKRRAYDYPVDAPSPVDYASLTSQTMANDPVLQNDPLKYERFAELFGEGHKWFDTRRWQTGAAEATYYESVRGGSINWEDTDYAQPIPTLEIETNPAIEFADQNPGY